MDPHRSDPVAPVDLEAGGLFHLATEFEWAGYAARGTIDPPSIGAEGFVHCSWGGQVAGTVGRHFAGIDDLLALRLDADRLDGVELVEEDSYGSGQTYPHAYGPVPAAAVIAVFPLA